MKLLLQTLVITIMLVALSGTYSRARPGGTDDPEKQEDVTTELNESGPEPVRELISKPKVFYNFLKSHYDDGLVFETKRGNFSVRYRTLIQFQFSAIDQDNNTDTDFFFRRFRLKFNGHVLRPWLTYRLQLSRDDVRIGQVGDGSGVEFKDFYIDAVYFDKIFPRIGQFKVPFNREQLNPGSALLLVERSIVNTEFSFGRKIGGALYGILGKHVAYGAAVYTSPATDDTADASSVDSETFAGRLQLNFGGTLEYSNGGFPTGGDYALVPDFTKVPVFVFGAAVVYLPSLSVKENEGDSGALIERFIELGISKGNVVSVTGDAAYKLPMFNVEAAYLGRWIEPEIGGRETVYDQGLRIQTGLFLMPDTIEIAGRWAYIFYDTSPAEAGVVEALRNNSSELTTGINYYISKSNNWKVQLSYTFISNKFAQGAPDTDQKGLRIQFQAYF
jgi:phosphate-selective porin OprO and OprP